MSRARADEGSTVALRDGRTIGVLEVGEPEGRPVFYFHGHPGSRVEALLAERSAKRHGLRLIALDRPGYGLSEAAPTRQILDWPRDVAEIADQRGIERFALLGVSGGGPYAAACAYALRRRVAVVALVAGLGPFDAPYAAGPALLPNRLVLGAGRILPFLPGLALTLMARLCERDPQRWIERMSKLMPSRDRETLAVPEVRRAMAAVVREAFRQGGPPLARDTQLYARPWGFDLAQIDAEVHVFQGGRDIHVPAAMGRYQAEVIPGAQLHFYEEDGHFSLAIDRMDDILSTLSSSQNQKWEAA